MRSALRLAIASAAAAGVFATVSAFTASAAVAALPINRVTFANLALTEMLTLSPGDLAITAPAAGLPTQAWDQVYATHLATTPGFSSPYLLRNRATGTCLADVGDGLNVIAVECEASPASDSAQLWQNYRVADRTVLGRDYYFRFNRATGRVLTAMPGPADSGARVVSAPAEPVSKSGAADHQLWVMLAL